MQIQSQGHPTTTASVCPRCVGCTSCPPLCPAMPSSQHTPCSWCCRWSRASTGWAPARTSKTTPRHRTRWRQRRPAGPPWTPPPPCMPTCTRAVLGSTSWERLLLWRHLKRSRPRPQSLSLQPSARSRQSPKSLSGAPRHPRSPPSSSHPRKATRGCCEHFFGSTPTCAESSSGWGPVCRPTRWLLPMQRTCPSSRGRTYPSWLSCLSSRRHRKQPPWWMASSKRCGRVCCRQPRHSASGTCRHR
mmetsp:Transcript_16384/g.41972  ORF Transcript_16384/g.41972 Transcript_16384/m.41972 type:complete len:245 (+) Transcript_16384:1012-1746(+)